MSQVVSQAVFDGEVDFKFAGHRAAAVLCRTEHGNLHLGVLHRASGGGTAVLHLGWQDSLSLKWPWLRLWAVPDAEPEKLLSVAGHCRQIWARFQRFKKFPYALGDFASTFDPNGSLQLAAGSKGLTCATFVMSVFRSAGIELVIEQDWPVRAEADRAWLATIRGFAHPDHFALLEAQVTDGVARVRPEEVLAACTVSPIPGQFGFVEPVAATIVAKLDRSILPL